MQTLTIIFIILALITAALIVYFQYYYKEKKNSSTLILSVLRFLTIFTILLLLINPMFIKNSFELIKPKLQVLIDNSASIRFSKQDSIVNNLVNLIKKNKSLNDKFDIQYFTFGNSLEINSKITYEQNQTNIYKALQDVNAVAQQQIAPILMISDGNQTFGNDYKYYKSGQSIYPIIVGDTVQFTDLEINRVNVNTYTYLDNNFPVEIFIRYSGNRNMNSRLIVEDNGQIVYTQNIAFSKNRKSAHLQFDLPANKVGKHLYRSRIVPFKNEKNQINNSHSFSVEVIDEQTNIALVYDILHPDIGMLKRAIESHKQRKVNLIDINTIYNDSIDNNIYILYQPNQRFDDIFREIKISNKNYFIITGLHTDWDFLNNIQSDFKKTGIINSESYYPIYNDDFNTFQAENISFSDFPSLESTYGKIEFSVPYQALLTQNINGIETENPLLTVFSYNNNRRVVLFGENIWKWRSISYSYDRSFEKFDQFLNSIIQYLSIAIKSNPIELEYKSFYYADEPIAIIAKSYDSNLNFDSNAKLELRIKGRQKSIPFYLSSNNYEVNLSDLKEGNYNFTVVNQQNSKKRTGNFTIGKYSIEQKSLHANSKDLDFLAKNSNGESFYPEQFNQLIQSLVANKNYGSLQIENNKRISLIDWKWLLGIIILSLSLEWFIRKYRGLI